VSSFELIPAIDLLDGDVVRLQQGRRGDKTIYSNDPAAFAENFERAGASILHIVDLNGAFDGRFGNLHLVREIRQATKMHLELGGGVRSMEDAEAAWEAGANDVIIGTKAVEDMDFVRDILRESGDAVIIGVDARDGFVATRGWTERSSIPAIEFAQRMAELGCRKIIYTDIATDGMLGGPNIEALKTMAQAVPTLKVIASGGVSSMTDIEAIRDLGLSNVPGCISGRALYDGRIDLALAVRIARCSS